MQRLCLSRCHHAPAAPSSEIQLERVSIHNPCHTPQNSVSLNQSPCGSSGIIGDIDIFRQSVYLILMLSNQSRRPPHGAAGRLRRRRPRRLASRASLPIHPSRLTESITMALPLFRVMSVLFHLSLSLIFLAAIRRARALPLHRCLTWRWVHLWHIAGSVVPVDWHQSLARLKVIFLFREQWGFFFPLTFCLYDLSPSPRANAPAVWMSGSTRLSRKSPSVW